MQNFKFGIVVALALFSASQTTAQDEPQGSSPAQKTDEKIKQNPKPQEFLGKWVGKWDDTYSVQFTISLAENKKDLSVVYEWEEVLGRPLRRSVGVGKIEGSLLKVGKIDVSLSADDANRGEAFGHFRQPRTAQIQRETPQQ